MQTSRQIEAIRKIKEKKMNTLGDPGAARRDDTIFPGQSTRYPRMMNILLTDSASVFKGSGPFLGPFGGPGSGSPEPESWSFSGPFVISSAMRAVVFFELYGFVSRLGSIGPSANIKVEDKVKSEFQTIFRPVKQISSDLRGARSLRQYVILKLNQKFLGNHLSLKKCMIKALFKVLSI